MRVAFYDRPERMDRWQTLTAELPVHWDVWLCSDTDAAEPLIAQTRLDAFLCSAADPDTALKLMALLRAESPHTLRVLVVPEGTDASLAAAFSLRCDAQQLLMEPVVDTDVRRLLHRLLTVRGLISDLSLRQQLGSLDRLPSPPATYLALMEAAADPDTPLEAITRPVEGDAALAARVLRIANSALLSRGRRITDIASAVNRLGIDMLSQLVLTAEIFDSEDPAVARHQQRALLALRLAQRIAADTAVPPSQAGTAALLADIDQLLPVELIADAQLTGHWHGLPVESLAGACLLALWGLPSELVEAVAYRHAPGLVDAHQICLTGVVHVAAALADGNSPDESYLADVGMLERLPEWRAMALEAAAEG